MEKHNEAVAIIATHVRRFFDCNETFRIYHGSTNSTRPSAVEYDKAIDTSNLSRILAIDVEKKTLLAEPNVSMDRLVEETMRHGLIPPVVPEFPGITVGGAFAGTGGESSSFKYGCFDRTINWIEMVLADGQIVTASDIEKQDLFRGAAGSLGTFGVITLLELQLIEARKYVHITYNPVASVSEAIEKIEEATTDSSVDYIDGILFALKMGVVIVGRLKDTLPDEVNIQQYTRARDPWFYLHAREMMSKSPTPTHDVAPLKDYLFRYDRGGFWVGYYAFRYFLMPFNRVTRWALDYFMHTRVMYHALHASGHSKQNIIQDVAVPYSTAPQFIEWLDETFHIYPLWLCPLHQSGEWALHPHTSSATRQDRKLQEDMLNVGVWGPGPTSVDEFLRLNRGLERKVFELSGIKWLYAHSYYTEEEFWNIYDQRWYSDLRIKYKANTLASVYDKVKVDLGDCGWGSNDSQNLSLRERLWIWPFSGLYGVLQTLIGWDYLLAKH